MAEDPANLILEHMRVVRADMHEMKDMLREQGHRLTRIETSVAGLRRERASDVENIAHLEARIDRLVDEITRTKQRLDIAD